MSTLLSKRFEDALLFATRLHAKQVRKATNIPYIAHLLAVTSIALEYGANEDEAIAALLHDAVEDQGGQAVLAEIRQRFGAVVAEIVLGCTDADVIPKPPWRARKEAYIAHAHSAPAAVKLVSAADKLHNVRAMLMDYRAQGDALWERFNGGKAGTLWYYRALVEALRDVRLSALIAELERAVAELEKLARAETER